MIKKLTLLALIASCSAFSAFAQNLVPNGDFADGLDEWTVDEGTVEAVVLSGGINAAQFSDLGQSALYSAALNTTAGLQYNFTYTVTNADDGYYFISLVQNLGAPGELFHDYYWNGTTTDTAPAITGTHIFNFQYTALAGDVIFISYSGNAPGNVSAVEVEAVPEPTTWALLGLGAIVVGFRLVRRRQVA